jgi:hypothetical protein
MRRIVMDVRAALVARDAAALRTAVAAMTDELPHRGEPLREKPAARAMLARLQARAFALPISLIQRPRGRCFEMSIVCRRRSGWRRC